METKIKEPILAIIGLGNPGPKYSFNRHNIGFLIMDMLADKYIGAWQKKELMDLVTIRIGDNKVLLVKPQTFMNLSGKVIPFLQKQGIKAENILVVHDELEYPFGKIKIHAGGSARGHNGLRSIIEYCGKDFARLRFGIGRPERKEMVGNYVLQNFTEKTEDVEHLIEQSVQLI
ncbi:aminoacyl-tRNA hydrolase, partial [bacterium]|nr:aminoacyl-tRNA hydrolase [bacterium]